MKKRIVAGMLLVLMLLTAGCSKNGGKDSITKSNEGTTVQQEDGGGLDVATIYSESNARGAITSVTIPNVIGKSLTEAMAELRANGLTVSSDIKYKTSDKAKDTVLLTSPLPGVSAPAGSAVRIICSSGEKREKSLTVVVDLPDGLSETTKLTVYVDGVPDDSKTTTVDPLYKKQVTYTFTGTAESQDVRVKLNDVLYKSYLLNFVTGQVTSQN